MGLDVHRDLDGSLGFTHEAYGFTLRPTSRHLGLRATLGAEVSVNVAGQSPLATLLWHRGCLAPRDEDILAQPRRCLELGIGGLEQPLLDYLILRDQAREEMHGVIRDGLLVVEDRIVRRQEDVNHQRPQGQHVPVVDETLETDEAR